MCHRLRARLGINERHLLRLNKLTSVQVAPDGEEGQVEGDVSHRGVRLKDGDHGQLHEDQEHRMLSVTQRHTHIRQGSLGVKRKLNGIKDRWCKSRTEDVLEFDGQWDGVEENVDLEDAEEEEAEMFKHLCKEVPEEADVRGQVRYRETGGGGQMPSHKDTRTGRDTVTPM